MKNNISQGQKKLKSIIIDDEPHAVSELADVLGMVSNILVVETFGNIRNALEFLQNNPDIDIVFSDIHMPNVNGIAAGKLFKTYAKYLVYVTAYRDFAIEAIGVDTNGYLVKPIRYIDVLNLVEKLQNNLVERESMLKNNDFLLFKGGAKNSYFKVMINEILYFEGMANYVKIHTVNGVKTTYMLLKEVEASFKTKNIFIRVAKSIVISLKFFDKIDGNMVYLENKEHFAVGIPYQQEFYRLLSEHYH